jgi:8-oxo-dGTP diphosphatase
VTDTAPSQTTAPIPGEGAARDDVPRTVAGIHWPTWQPKDLATLTFVREGDEVLLIHKKRGLGRGKVNAPGGRLEGDETLEQCAVREVQEELHVTPTDLDERGELRFQFVDGYSLHVHVYVAHGHEGTATATEEAEPRWTPVDAIPFDQMWVDDQHWLPHMLAGRRFDGRFVFDGEDMLDMDLRVDGEPSRC